MVVANILKTKKYELTDEEKVLVIKNWLGREGWQLKKTFTNEKKENCNTAKGLFSVLHQSSSHAIIEQYCICILQTKEKEPRICLGVDHQIRNQGSR